MVRGSFSAAMWLESWVLLLNVWFWDEMLQSSAVSGAVSYPELCMAAKTEEQYQAELKRRQQYCRAEQTKNDARTPLNTSQYSQANGSKGGQGSQEKRPPSRSGRGSRDCYTCGSTEHLAKDYRQRGGESAGRLAQHGSNGSGTKNVTTQPLSQEMEENPWDRLYSSDSDDQSARMISVQDKGSCPKYARVTVEEESCLGITDTGSDITCSTKHLFCTAVGQSGLIIAEVTVPRPSCGANRAR